MLAAAVTSARIQSEEIKFRGCLQLERKEDTVLGPSFLVELGEAFSLCG